MKKNQLRIAVIDDGINEMRFSSGGLEHNIEIREELDVRERSGYDPFATSHGTICAAIIKKYFTGAFLCSVKILNENSKTGNGKQLVKALEWCAENGMDVANISLGTIDYRDFDKIKKAVRYCRGKGLIIVAACNNRDIYTCPASLPECIGVRSDKHGELSEGQYIYNVFAPDGIEITACGKHCLTEYTERKYEVWPCNSFAAPLITGMVCRIINENPGLSLHEIEEQLKARAKKHFVSDKNAYLKNKKDFDPPLIMFYDLTGEKAVPVLDEITGLFKADGYNAIAVDGGKPESVLNLTDFPDKYFSKQTAVDMPFLQMLCKIYDPDVFIIGKNKMGGFQTDNFSGAEGVIDVLILAVNNFSPEMEKIIRSVPSDTKLIILSFDEIQFNGYCHAKIFHFAGNLTSKLLYDYMIGLFQTNVE